MLIVHARLASREGRRSAARQRRQGLPFMSFEQAATHSLVASPNRSITNAFVPLSRRSFQPLRWVSLNASSHSPALSMRPPTHCTRFAGRHRSIGAGSRSFAARRNGPGFPIGMMRALGIAGAAMERAVPAQAVVGSMEIVGLTELLPCWRPLLKALTEQNRP